jgi:hypothetical protein
MVRLVFICIQKHIKTPALFMRRSFSSEYDASPCSAGCFSTELELTFTLGDLEPSQEALPERPAKSAKPERETCEVEEVTKRKRAGVHIINKRGLNAKSKHEPLQFPSHLLPNLPASLSLSIKRSLPLASPVQPLPQRVQRAYGSSEAPLNEYEQVLYEMNGLLPVAALLQIGPYVVPLLVLRFVVDKTGRFLALVTCPWSKSRRVFSLFHFFKNMLHLLHQMDKDARLALLQKFGDSQVLFVIARLACKKTAPCTRSARLTTIFS